MNVYEAVKAAVSLADAARFYGLDVRQGFARCPFHPDRTPSLKIDHRYHCFGCGADGGDATDLVAALFHLAPLEAAKKVAADFGVGYDAHSPPKPCTARKRPGAVRAGEERAYRVLCLYLHRLQAWREEYAPAPEDGEWHPLFVEALREIDRVDYLLDILLYGESEEKAALVNNCRGRIAALERRLAPAGDKGMDIAHKSVYNTA